MKTLYAVYDKKAEEIMAVWLDNNDNQATRRFMQTMQVEGPIKEYPADYNLIAIATIDSERCEIECSNIVLPRTGEYDRTKPREVAEGRVVANVLSQERNKP